MSLPAGATFAPGEIERAAKALKALANDPHAPKLLDLRVTLHVHHEYPKLLYKGTGTKKSITVADADAEQAARADGWGEHVPEPDPETVELSAQPVEQTNAQPGQAEQSPTNGTNMPNGNQVSGTVSGQNGGGTL